MCERRNDEEAVRHLTALGYVDPLVVAAREAAVRRQLEAELQQAVKHYEAGDLQEARHRLERLIVDDSSWVAPRQLLAEIYYRSELWADARSQIDWLTVHGVEHPRLALIVGAIALANRDFETALDVLKYATHVEPTLPSAHTLLGTTFRRLRVLDRAEDEFRKAIIRNPNDAQALDGLAAICIQHQDFAEAASRALEALDHDMQLFAAHYRLGVALSHLDRPREAVAALEMSAKSNPSVAAPYYWLAQIALKQLHDPALASQYRERGREVIRRRHQTRHITCDVGAE